MYKSRLLLLLSCIFVIGCSNPAEQHAELVREFSEIEVLEGAILVSRSSSYEIGQALYGGSYNSDQTFSVIWEHYIDELEKNGWVYETSKEMTFRGENLGGECISFLKDDKVAEFQYAGEKAEFGWDYAFSIGWGLTGC